jgi:thiol-disulfide isomerase/thioredoxin
MFRWKRSAVLVAASSLVLFEQPVEAQEDQIGIALGAIPEAVVVEDLDGEPVPLADYVGRKPVLLEFWATWCPLCKALEPKMQAAYTRYGEDVEFVIIAVAVNQTPRRVRRHLEEHELPGRVLWDTDGRAVRAFMAPSTSYVVVLDEAGKVVYTGLGEDQNIESALQKAIGR